MERLRFHSDQRRRRVEEGVNFRELPTAICIWMNLSGDYFYTRPETEKYTFIQPHESVSWYRDLQGPLHSPRETAALIKYIQHIAMHFINIVREKMEKGVMFSFRRPPEDTAAGSFKNKGDRHSGAACEFIQFHGFVHPAPETSPWLISHFQRSLLCC